MEQGGGRGMGDMVSGAVRQRCNTAGKMRFDMGEVAAQPVIRPEFDPVIRAAIEDRYIAKAIILLPAKSLGDGRMKMVEKLGKVAPGS